MRPMQVIDGGLATLLTRNGHNFINNDPLWSARLLQTDPESIFKAHKEFSDNGASILITASYQASIEGLVTHLGVNSDEGLKVFD